MSYRRNNTPPPKPEDNLHRFEVRNGAIIDIAFPCFYIDVVPVHDSHYHDHVGWPSPHHPGHSCQRLPHIPAQYHAGDFEYFDLDNPHPIPLTSNYEGYTDAYVVLDNPIDGLTVSAWLDEDEGNVVRMRAKAAVATFEDKPKDCRFTLFIHAPARTYDGKAEQERIDEVFHGMITILPGAIS